MEFSLFCRKYAIGTKISAWCGMNYRVGKVTIAECSSSDLWDSQQNKLTTKIKFA